MICVYRLDARGTAQFHPTCFSSAKVNKFLNIIKKRRNFLLYRRYILQYSLLRQVFYLFHKKPLEYVQNVFVQAKADLKRYK